jgi:serine/threonine protein kinase
MADVPSALSFTKIFDRPWLERLSEIRAQTVVPAGIGPYRVSKLLGRGGMGSVFLAERADGHFERQVAVKLLDHGLTLSREAGLLAKLDHPAIARLLDAGSAPDGRHYLVLQYVEGAPLSSSQVREPAAIARLFIVLAEALDHAHSRGVIHRDIKPSNILLRSDGAPVLIDFSAATELRAQAPDATRTLYRALTPNFASPEQIAGEAGTEQSDIYSLGLVLRSVLPSGPPASLLLSLRKIAAKATEQDPELRYANARDLASDLQAALTGRALEASKLRRHRALFQYLRKNALAAPFLAFALAWAAGAYLAWSQYRVHELTRQIRELTLMTSPTVAYFNFDDPGGYHRRAMLSTIGAWRSMLANWGPEPRILHGLYQSNASYAILLVGPATNRPENVPQALPYLRDAMKIADQMTGPNYGPCSASALRASARVSLANADIAINQLNDSLPLLDEARRLALSLPQVPDCERERESQLLEIEAVRSRVLFAQKRWPEVIAIRRSLLRRRVELAERALREKWPARLDMEISCEHGKTSLAWALSANGDHAAAYSLYASALERLEALHRRSPALAAITIRLAKFHREAATIASALRRGPLVARHEAAARHWESTLGSF